jgi:hypothetical protein
MLVWRSHELLEGYRRGEAVGQECPLQTALTSGPARLADTAEVKQ